MTTCVAILLASLQESLPPLFLLSSMVTMTMEELKVEYQEDAYSSI
jgi:hypothetical protein